MVFLQRYLMIAIACAALLVGIQLPNLADQYTKRVDAHLREVTANLLPFQQVANQYANGSLEGLIAMHRRADQPVFRAEADAIEKLLRRKQRFEAEFLAVQKSLPLRIGHILLQGDRELLDQTVAQYSANVPLDQDAILFGAVFAFAVLLLIDVLLALYRQLARQIKRQFNHRWHGA